MFTAMVFLLAGALGAQPASSAMSSRENVPAISASNAEIISVRTEGGEVRLNLSEVHFDREAKVGTSSPGSKSASLETAEEKNTFATAVLPAPAPCRRAND